MADITSGTPEAVALDLLERIAAVERKVMHASPDSGATVADRTWILDAYAECLAATKDRRRRAGTVPPG